MPPIPCRACAVTESRSLTSRHAVSDGVVKPLDLGGNVGRLRGLSLGNQQILGVQHDSRADHYAGGNADALLNFHRD